MIDRIEEDEEMVKDSLKVRLHVGVKMPHSEDGHFAILPNLQHFCQEHKLSLLSEYR